MRLSEFRRAVADEFGAHYGSAITRDLVLHALGDRTAERALADGTPAREVWLALCEAEGVPLARRHGAGLIDPRD